MEEDVIQFKFEKVQPSIIMVVGVGGGGSNAVNHMHDLGIADVTFMVCNTDQQALAQSPVPIKQHLGRILTKGLGAGNNPEKGKAAALESLDEITEIFKREGTRMVFITAGMGGGTGTGGAPVIAKAAKSMGILTVAIVTMPLKNEGKKRAEFARLGIAELRNNVDALLVINTEKIQEMFGELPLKEAFGKADDILASAAKGISEIITGQGLINVDFEDVTTVMKDSGVTMMGTARGKGEDRATQVAKECMSSPLLDHNYIKGAKDILLNISSSDGSATLSESNTILEYVQNESGNVADIIWGMSTNPALEQGEIEVTIIAARFGDDVNDIILGNDYKFITSTIHPKGDKPTLEPNTVALEDVLGASTPFAGREVNVVGVVEQMPVVDDVQSQVIELKTNELYANLADVISRPAFVRRKTRLIEDRNSVGGKTSRVRVIPSEKTSHEAEVQENDLFNNLK